MRQSTFRPYVPKFNSGDGLCPILPVYCGSKLSPCLAELAFDTETICEFVRLK